MVVATGTIVVLLYDLASSSYVNVCQKGVFTHLCSPYALWLQDGLHEDYACAE